jgi:hypothetical protein
MKKASFLWIILDVIFLIIFNVFFFVLGEIKHNVSVWVSYGFIHFAYLMLLLTPKLIRDGKSSVVFGFSLYSISAVYFLIEFVTGIVFIFISIESYKVAFSVQLCIAGLYVIMLLSYLITNEHTADVEEKRQYQIAFVKNASAKLKGLLEKINDKEDKKKVEKVYDAINSSPIKSHTDIVQIEEKILMSINELEDAVSTCNKENIISLTDSLLFATNKRNNRLKTLN